MPYKPTQKIYLKKIQDKYLGTLFYRYECDPEINYISPLRDTLVFKSIRINTYKRDILFVGFYSIISNKEMDFRINKNQWNRQHEKLYNTGMIDRGFEIIVSEPRETNAG